MNSKNACGSNEQLQAKIKLIIKYLESLGLNTIEEQNLDNPNEMLRVIGASYNDEFSYNIGELPKSVKVKNITDEGDEEYQRYRLKIRVNTFPNSLLNKSDNYFLER